MIFTKINGPEGIIKALYINTTINSYPNDRS